MSISDIIFISKRGNYLRLSEMARMEKTALFDLRYSPDKLAYKSGVDAFNITSGTSYQIINSKFVNIKVGEYEDAGDSDVYTGYAEPHLDYTKHITIPIYSYEHPFPIYVFDTYQSRAYESDALFMSYTTYPEYHFLPLPNTDFIADIDNPLVWSRVYLHDFEEYRGEDAGKPFIDGQTIKFDIDLYNFSDNTYAVFQITGSYALDNFRLPYLNNSNNELLDALQGMQDVCVEPSGVRALNILSITDITLLKPSQSNKDNYELIAYSGVDKPPAFRKKNFEIELNFPSITFSRDGLTSGRDHKYINPEFSIVSEKKLFFSRFGQVNNLYYFLYTVFVKADSMEEGRQKLYDLTGKYYDNTTADDEILVGSYFRPNYLEVGDDFIFMRNTDSPRTIGGVIPFIPTIAALFDTRSHEGIYWDNPKSSTSSYSPFPAAYDSVNYYDKDTIESFLETKSIAELHSGYYLNEDKEIKFIEGFEITTDNFLDKLAYISNGLVRIKFTDSLEFVVTNSIPFIGECYPSELDWIKDRIIMMKSDFPFDVHVPFYFYANVGREIVMSSNYYTDPSWTYNRKYHLYKPCGDGSSRDFLGWEQMHDWFITDQIYIFVDGSNHTIWCDGVDCWEQDYNVSDCEALLNEYTLEEYQDYLQCLFDHVRYCANSISCLLQLYFDYSTPANISDSCSSLNYHYNYIKFSFYHPVYCGHDTPSVGRTVGEQPDYDNVAFYACEVIPYRPKAVKYSYNYYKIPMNFANLQIDPKFIYNYPYYKIYKSYINDSLSYNFFPFRYEAFGESIGSIFS